MEKLVQSQKDSWFNGHRANIVTYSLALIANKTKLNKKAINFELIWKSQAVPAAIELYLLELAKQVNDLLKDDSRPVGNIDSYAKTEGFWLTAKSSIEVDLGRLAELLADQSEVIEQKKDDKKLQKLTTSLQDEITVRSVTKDKWSDIKSYLEDNHLENPSKLALIAKAQLNPIKLTEKECQFLFVILDEFESFYRE